MWYRYRSCGSKLMKLQKLEYVIFGRFQRPITPKFWGGGAGKKGPPMTQSRPLAFIWYRFHSCGLRSLWVYKRTKSKKSVTDGRTDRPTSPKLYPFASRGIKIIGHCARFQNNDVYIFLWDFACWIEPLKMTKTSFTLYLFNFCQKYFLIT